MRSDVILRVVTMTCLAAVWAGSMVAAEQRGPMFYTDDPVQVDNDAAVNASGAKKTPLGAYADFVLNTFMTPGDRRRIRATNVNTLDEVPDSSWFTNRIGTRPMTVPEIVRGPDLTDRLPIADWVIVEGKDTGRQPGFRAVSASDPDGDLFQIEFDPARNPEMATGAELIGTAIYHALGYNVVDTYLIELDPARLAIAPSATISSNGTERPFTREDLERILRRAARRTDGRYRATASRFAAGRPLGPFRYYGTRPDDPNDIHPHEHRRELRANRVFAAWLNHDDSRAGNSLDMLVGPVERQWVKHYMFDFGSILGSGTNEEDHPWVGHEYVVEARPALLSLVSLGLWRRPFINVSAPYDLPAAGNFTADGFNPLTWRPHYPNPAFRNLRPDDAFWAARRIAAFTPAAISAIVEKARFSDPRVIDHMTGTLLRRRELVLRAWLSAVLPVVSGRIDAAGTLRFDNAAVAAGIAEAPAGYELTWFRYDNAAGTHHDVARSRATSDGTAVVPVSELSGAAFVAIDVRAANATQAAWRQPVRFYFRVSPDGWMPVGVDRHSGSDSEHSARR